ncbi:hypothetical protein [Cupriavidus necator]|uniref:hypothetical protein n=1 Tax=Cupriavidus necator TaxID=106590 RepID=UPI0020BF2953|nr:hypothetical protein [Cupriavidus necator]
MDFSLRIGTTGSQVPYQSLNRSHAAFMPDADWAVSRRRPTLSRSKWAPRFRHLLVKFSTRHQRFTFVRLFDPYLTEFIPAFSSDAHHAGSLPTQLVAVWSPLLQADSEGPSFIFGKAPYQSLNRSHAAFMPDADWAVSRRRPTLSRSKWAPRFRHLLVKFSTRHQRFTFVRLFDPYLTEFIPAFSSDAHHAGSLPTQLVAVWSPLLQADSEGPSFIFGKAPQVSIIRHPAFLAHPTHFSKEPYLIRSIA